MNETFKLVLSAAALSLLLINESWAQISGGLILGSATRQATSRQRY